MKWDNARKLSGKLLGGTKKRERSRDGKNRGGRRSGHADQLAHSGGPHSESASPGSICIASGKGGTGKSVFTASLSAYFSEQVRTLIVDADMGVGNAHILHDVSPEMSFVDVVENEASMGKVVSRVRPTLDLVAAGSGVSHMAELSSYDVHLVARGLEAIEQNYDALIVDSAAGISGQTVAFAAACDVCVIVTTPDVTALTDAYAFLKVFLRRKPTATPLLVVNRAPCLEEGRKVAERVVSVAERFLGRAPRHVGCLPYDESVMRSVNARVPALDFDPEGPFAEALRDVGAAIRSELERVPHRGLGRSLLRSVGYTPESTSREAKNSGPGFGDERRERGKKNRGGRRR